MRRTAHILLIIISLTSSLTNGAPQPQHTHGGSCIPDERAALLSFRKDITDDNANLLASWRGQDCCRWRGIKCSNQTGHVIKLHLRNLNAVMHQFSCHDDNALYGKISLSLLSLKHLEHMDLSMNCLIWPYREIPHLLGSMVNLRYLNLSGIPFAGRVPPQLGNLSKLQYLDIDQLFDEYGAGMYSPDVTWLTNLPKLKHLGMSGIDLSGIADWPHVLNMLPSLRVIRLASCSLDTGNQSLPYLNLTKLEELDLSINELDHTIGSSWFWKATSIKYLNLGRNALFGQIPHALGNMTSLRFLDLSCNLMKDMVITGSLKNLCSLEVLDFSSNDMTGVLMEALPQCAWKQLQELRFRENSFNGTLPSLIEKFISLNTLDLSENNLNGCIPSGIGALTNLAYLDLSYNNFIGSLPFEIGALTNLGSLDLSYNKFCGSVPSEIGALTNLAHLDLSSNNFSGVITEKNLENLQSLKYIDLSFNNLKVVVDPDWVHPFKLECVLFAYCQMGPLFPAWLERQHEIMVLNISRTGLEDKIPDWFWFTVSHAKILDISHNQISGSLPANLHSMSVEALNLRSNQFTGSLPPLPRNITMLDISSNAFSGTLPSYLEAPNLGILQMYSNKIGGRIPDYVCKLDFLEYLDMSDNILEGKIPRCFGCRIIKNLLLSNNSLSGTFPGFLKKCISLEFLDLAWNKFHGRLPTWIGELGSLHILRLGHNAFSGTIPATIADLTNLQYFDLSSNNMSGVIPSHLSNLTCMTLKGFMPIELHTMRAGTDGRTMYRSYDGEFEDILSISTKGQRLRYGRTLEYLVGIDLSDNSLTGGIPTGITSLNAVINLNLSSNQLSGRIPNEIGALHSLESLDLSNNMLSGKIPSSLSSLSSLSYLNLSYNSLSGRIPSGRQLDTLSADKPALIYIGNIGLCGPPLQKNCSGNGTAVHGHPGSSTHEFDPMTFNFGLVLGLVAGLWVVFCVLLFKRTWRAAYFRLFDELYDWIYVYVAVKWAKLHEDDT